ncbi:MAG TPA: four-carbon acid sugar kinase family protein [Candidatus Limnocylindrales bacterium]|nr:four-carbon acid sugar kinase family protein [Candidatus Limnocylindrales bacterium]
MGPDPRARVPPAWGDDPLPLIRRLSRARPVVVLDDDPTGTQTVRDVPVLTLAGLDGLDRVLRSGVRAAFVLTNSRSLSAAAAANLAGELGARLAAAAERTRRRISVVSRSDSTLRGHFPVEVDALTSALGRPDAPILLMPYFGEAGRITVNDVHYLVRDGVPVPVAETEFARDATFGYRESNLRDWVAARVGEPARPIASIPLELIRTGGPEVVASALRALPPRAVCVANAIVDRDVEVVAAGVLMAERAGLPIVARTAASFVRARAGQRRHPLLAVDELRAGRGAGLVVVGSHVPGTTRQLERLLADPPSPLHVVEIEATLAADPARAGRVVRTAARQIAGAMDEGRTAVVVTSRIVLPGTRGEDAAAGLERSARVSAALAGVVAALPERPAWIVAKGGITSSDVATLGLGVSVARVLGQIVAGVPVWRCGAGSRWPGLPLVVFPGNVGTDDDLRRVVATLERAARRPRPARIRDRVARR